MQLVCFALEIACSSELFLLVSKGGWHVIISCFHVLQAVFACLKKYPSRQLDTPPSPPKKAKNIKNPTKYWPIWNQGKISFCWRRRRRMIRFPPSVFKAARSNKSRFFLAPPQRFPFPFPFFYSSIARMYLWQSEMHRWRKKRGKGHLSSFTQGRGEETAYRQNFFLLFFSVYYLGNRGESLSPLSSLWGTTYRDTCGRFDYTVKTISFPGLWYFPPFFWHSAPKKGERERTRQFSRNCFCGMGNGGCSALGLLCRTFFPKRGRGNWMHNFSRMPIRRRWKTGKLPFRTPKHPYYNNEFPNPSNWKPYISTLPV